jgi:AcrR family transcriptional regulator
MEIGKRYHHGNLKAALINAGLEIVEESGLADLSLRNCAKRVGVSHTAIKNHFGNMAGLINAMAACGYQQLASWMQNGLISGASRSERRNAALIGYVDFATDHPSLYELMFMRSHAGSNDSELMEQISQCYAILQDVSHNLDWDKSGKPDCDLRAQMMFWSIIHGYVQLSSAGKFSKDSMKNIGIMEIMPDFPYLQ